MSEALQTVEKILDSQAERFLSRGNWKSIGISPVIVREIQRITDRYD